MRSHNAKITEREKPPTQLRDSTDQRFGLTELLTSVSRLLGNNRLRFAVLRYHKFNVLTTVAMLCVLASTPPTAPLLNIRPGKQVLAERAAHDQKVPAPN